MQVEVGQLRQWKAAVPGSGYAGDLSSGSMFLVLGQDPDFKNYRFWRVLQSAGKTRILSETMIAETSEVISEAR